MVYNEFKEQLTRSPSGWYETRLPWHLPWLGTHPPLPTNKIGSIRRLQFLERRLQRKDLVEDYNTVIGEQKQQGIVEPANNKATGKEFYIPHKEVVRESAQSRKLRVVYDASAKDSPECPSLNDCLYAGPPLQNKLWEILVRARSFPVAITCDVEKAFLQIRVKECERDALRFHWRANPETMSKYWDSPECCSVWYHHHSYLVAFWKPTWITGRAKLQKLLMHSRKVCMSMTLFRR